MCEYCLKHKLICSWTGGLQSSYTSFDFMWECSSKYIFMVSLLALQKKKGIKYC